MLCKLAPPPLNAQAAVNMVHSLGVQTVTRRQPYESATTFSLAANIGRIFM